ncbi:hypothetical protein AAG570_005708 [Ranatra chinensis]|uniref:FAST kinase leucine-rich domain-containing protein n=1 Tax=Ranatra chinensis TaxID=642074 RepID=A0ABD0XYK4_9HEMI
MYELEARLEDSLDLLSVEEIGVATLGFFKTQTVIHGASLQEALIRRIIKEVDTIPEQALVSIIKALRMSLVIPVWPMAESLLGVLCSQIGRISLKGCAHIVLLTARTHSVHSQILDLVSQKLLKSIDQARLKDLEKVLYPLTTLNYDPKTSPCIFEAIAAELNRPERQQEFTIHPKCLVAIVHYLALLSIFPHDAIARVLDMNFIRETYGRTNYMIGREILSIETCLEIDSPGYSGPRLPEDVRNYLSKRYSTFLPNREKRLSKHGAFVLDVIDTLEIVLGKECMVCKYVLPNNSRADVVFGLDREGKALPIPDDYRNHPDFTGVLRLPKVDGDWRAIVLCSLNMLVRNRAGAPNGETAAKIRHLRKLGYTPLMVTFLSPFRNRL